MAWRRPGDKPLSEPMMVRLVTHICVTRPQWVKWYHINRSHSAIKQMYMKRQVHGKGDTNYELLCIPLSLKKIFMRGAPHKRPVTLSFVSSLNKLVNKQPRCRWFETAMQTSHRSCDSTEMRYDNPWCRQWRKVGVMTIPGSVLN